MQISAVIPQLRTTDLAASIAFYTTMLGFTLEFRVEDFYAGLRAGEYPLHLKLSDCPTRRSRPSATTSTSTCTSRSPTSPRRPRS